MATKYFCDICEGEIEEGRWSRIGLWVEGRLKSKRNIRIYNDLLVHLECFHRKYPEFIED